MFEIRDPSVAVMKLARARLGESGGRKWKKDEGGCGWAPEDKGRLVTVSLGEIGETGEEKWNV